MLEIFNQNYLTKKSKFADRFLNNPPTKAAARCMTYFGLYFSNIASASFRFLQERIFLSDKLVICYLPCPLTTTNQLILTIPKVTESRLCYSIYLKYLINLLLNIR